MSITKFVNNWRDIETADRQRERRRGVKEKYKRDAYCQKERGVRESENSIPQGK